MTVQHKDYFKMLVYWQRSDLRFKTSQRQETIKVLIPSCHLSFVVYLELYFPGS